MYWDSRCFPYRSHRYSYKRLKILFKNKSILRVLFSPKREDRRAIYVDQLRGPDDHLQAGIIARRKPIKRWSLHCDSCRECDTSDGYNHNKPIFRTQYTTLISL